MKAIAALYDTHKALSIPELFQSSRGAANLRSPMQSYDTVDISEMARNLARTGTVDGNQNAEKAGDTGKDAGSAMQAHMGKRLEPDEGARISTGISDEGSADSEYSAVEELQKQIREAEKKLAEAQDELTQAISEAGTANARPAAKAPQAPPAQSTAGHTPLAGGLNPNDAAAGADGASAAASDPATTQGAPLPEKALPSPADNSNVKMLQMKVTSINSELMQLRKALEEAMKTENEMSLTDF